MSTICGDWHCPSVTPAGRCVASLNKQEFADRGAWHDISNGIFAVFVTLELSFVEAVPEWTRLQSETAALLNNFLIERGEWFVIVLQWLYHFIMVLKRRKLQDLHNIYIYIHIISHNYIHTVVCVCVHMCVRTWFHKIVTPYQYATWRSACLRWSDVRPGIPGLWQGLAQLSQQAVPSRCLVANQDFNKRLVWISMLIKGWYLYNLYDMI